MKMGMLFVNYKIFVSDDSKIWEKPSLICPDPSVIFFLIKNVNILAKHIVIELLAKHCGLKYIFKIINPENLA